LPANSLLLLSNQLVFNLGFYMVVPFLAVYLREDMALTGSAIGLVLGLRTFSQQGLFVFGGALSDRLGPRRLILLGCIVRVAGYAFLGLGGHIATILIGACLTGVGGALFSPALSTLIAKVGETSEKAGKRSRAQYFALLGVWGELGAVLGPVAGALLLGVGFQAMAFIGAGVFVCAFFVLLAFLPRDEARPVRHEQGSFAPVLGDRLFLTFILAHGAYLFCYNQLYLALPIEIARSGGGERDLAPMFMIASVLVITLQLPITRLARHVGVQVSMPFGFALMAVAFAIVAVLAPLTPATAPWSLAPAVIMVVILSLGQMIVRPLAMDLVPTFAAGRPTGVYYGALASVGGVFVLVGNVVLGPLLDWALIPSARASVPWIVLALVPAISAFAMLAVTRRLTSHKS